MIWIRLRRPCVFPATRRAAARVCSSRASAHSKRRWRKCRESRASGFVIFVVLDWLVPELAARRAQLAIAATIAPGAGVGPRAIADGERPRFDVVEQLGHEAV